MKSSRVRGLSVASFALVAIAALAGAAPAQAASGTTLKAQEHAVTAEGQLGTSEQSMVDVWTEYGVPAATQDALLEKLHAGNPIDSMNSATPVSTESHLDGAKQTTVSRYEDGSISISTIEPDPSSPSARSVDGCTVNATTYAQNCKVYGWFGGVELQFRSSYTKQDLHASVYNWGQTDFLCGPGMTCSSPKFELVRQYQSGSLAAQINLKTTWSSPIANGTTTLILYAKDRSAWTN